MFINFFQRKTIKNKLKKKKLQLENKKKEDEEFDKKKKIVEEEEKKEEKKEEKLTKNESENSKSESGKPGLKCLFCKTANFENNTIFRSHFKSEWHNFNLRRKIEVNFI